MKRHPHKPSMRTPGRGAWRAKLSSAQRFKAPGHASGSGFFLKILILRGPAQELTNSLPAFLQKDPCHHRPHRLEEVLIAWGSIPTFPTSSILVAESWNPFNVVWKGPGPDPGALHRRFAVGAKPRYWPHAVVGQRARWRTHTCLGGVHRAENKRQIFQSRWECYNWMHHTILKSKKCIKKIHWKWKHRGEKWKQKARKHTANT